MSDDSIWIDAPVEIYLSDDDFIAEFGRLRTAEEKDQHDMFNDAAMLEEPESYIEVRKDGKGEQIELRICPDRATSGEPGRTWWPRVRLSDGTHAVFCQEVITS